MFTKLLSMFFCVVLAAALVSCPANGAKRALLIGISKYQKQPRLNGPVNDVVLVKDMLMGWYAFPEDDITVLTDKSATRDRIEREILKLSKSSQQDNVVIYYSGHGTLAPKAPSFIEALVPYDGDNNKADTLLTKDDLRVLMATFHTATLDLIMDCCFSGAYIKSITQTTDQKFVAATNMPDDVLKKFSDNSSGDDYRNGMLGPTESDPTESEDSGVRGKQTGKVVSRPGQAIICASTSGREVPDTEFQLTDGSKLKASALALLMYRCAQANPNSSYKDFMTDIQGMMTDWKLKQRPGLYFVTPHRKPFGGPAEGIREWALPLLPLQHSRKDTAELEVIGGRALGVSAGNQVTIIGPAGAYQKARVVRADWWHSWINVPRDFRKELSPKVLQRWRTADHTGGHK